MKQFWRTFGLIMVGLLVGCGQLVDPWTKMTHLLTAIIVCLILILSAIERRDT